MKNVLVGQSGGPTAVINSSLAGVYETAKACGAPHVYGMQYGTEACSSGFLLDRHQEMREPFPAKEKPEGSLHPFG